MGVREQLGGFLFLITTGLLRYDGLACLDFSRPQQQEVMAYGIGGLLLLVALLVSRGLGLVWLALLAVEGLPSFPEDFADLAWNVVSARLANIRKVASPYRS